MNVVDLLLATGLSLVFLVAVFRPLELALPAKPGQRFFRPDWLTDLFFLLGQYLLWNGLVFWSLLQSRTALNAIVPYDFRSAVAAQPFWLQVLEVVFLSDFCVYWGHRLQHRSSFLWRFHSVHHSAEHLDWLAAHREHPLDTVYTLTLINLPAFVLGFPLEPLAGFIAFRGIWAIYIHSNVRLPLGPLRPLLGAPELHHWHHARDRDVGNYGNVCPLMDIIFGTHVSPEHEPESLGLNQPTATTWLGHMIRPLLPKQRATGEPVDSSTMGGVQSTKEQQPTGATDEQTHYRGRADSAKLCNSAEPVMICTADGTVLGYFTPAPPQKLNLQPQISEEEMARRMADTTSPTYTTEEVIRYLKGLPKGP